jgi:hypothetical protein
MRSARQNRFVLESKAQSVRVEEPRLGQCAGMTSEQRTSSVDPRAVPRPAVFIVANVRRRRFDVPALQVEAEAIGCLCEFAERFPSVLDPLGLKVKLNVCNEGGQTRTSFS